MLEREECAAGSEFPDELPTEAKAVEAVRSEIDEDVDFRELLEAQLADAEEWARSEQKYRTRLHAKLQHAYTIYVLAAGNSKREALIQRRCTSAGIVETQASHLSIRLVKLMLRPADKTIYQYAAALRYAAMKKIRVNDLAAALKKGGGIAKFAECFWQKVPTLSSDNEDDGEDNGDASEEASGSKDRRSTHRGHDASAEAAPEFKWNDKALKLYAEATTGDRIRQVAEKNPDGRWKVIKIGLVA